MVYMKIMPESTPFKSSLDVYEWMSGFIKQERQNNPRLYRLERMKTYMDFLGHPELSIPSIHTAGSKGKGSVTGIITSILQAKGIKTARYASPHLNDFRERVSLGNEFFPEEIYSSAGNELRSMADSLQKDMEITFFDLMTCWYFLCARHSSCGALAVETGLGGRIDATNIIDPLVSVITIIELEHTEILGDTIAAIAGEKAGIIKPGRPLVLAEQKNEALEVFIKHAQEKNSPLIYFPLHAEVKNIRFDRNGTFFDLHPKSNLLDKIYSNLHIGIPGIVQAYNASLAILAVKTAYPDISEEQIRRGINYFTLPGRFERIMEKPELIIDGAHTGKSMELCQKTFTDLYGTGGILIFGCADGKDLKTMAELCTPNFSKIFITAPGNFKKSNPEAIYSVFHEENKKLPSPCEIILIPDTDEAINKAIEAGLKENLPVLGTGSFYLAGEIRQKALDAS